MAGLVHLDVVTPMRHVLSEQVEAVVLPGADGAVSILYNHAPIIIGLTIGMLSFGPVGGEKRLMFISGGFAEVAKNRVTVLADVAELAEEIDVMRARAAKARAEKRLQQHAEHHDFQRAQLALQRAVTRLRVAGRTRH